MKCARNTNHCEGLTWLSWFSVLKAGGEFETIVEGHSERKVLWPSKEVVANTLMLPYKCVLDNTLCYFICCLVIFIASVRQEGPNAIIRPGSTLEMRH